MIDVDSLFINMNEKGFYQVSQYVVSGLTFFPIALSLLKLVFIGFVPKSKCAPLNISQLHEYGYSSNETHKVVYEECNINIFSLDGNSTNETLACINGFSYDQLKDHSFVSEWDLVCSKAGLAELTQTLYAVGGVVGSLVIPYFSDTKGRKPILVLNGILTLIVSVGSSFSPNYVVFTTLRALEGLFIQGLSVSCFTIMLEHFPVSSKTLMCGLSGVLWGCCVIPIGPLAYLLRKYNWRVNNIVFSATHAFVLFQFWYLEESLRWVVTNGYVEWSKKIIKRATKYNRVDFNKVWNNNMLSTLVPLVSSENRNGATSKEDLTQQAKIKEEGFHTIFKDPLARRITIIIFIVGLMNSLTYYGIYLTSSGLAGNQYLNFFLVSITEVIANSLMAMMLFKLQRRVTMALFQCLSGLALLLSVIIANIADGSRVYSILNTVFSMIGMFGISASYCVIWLYTPEVYPTNLRNIGLGFLTLCGAIGSMISPYSRIVMLYIPWLPGIIFSVGSLASVFLLFLMPETQFLQMPTTMNDVRNQMKSQKRKKKKKKGTSDEENNRKTNLSIQD